MRRLLFVQWALELGSGWCKGCCLLEMGENIGHDNVVLDVLLERPPSGNEMEQNISIISFIANVKIKDSKVSST